MLSVAMIWIRVPLLKFTDDAKPARARMEGIWRCGIWVFGYLGALF